MRAPTFTAARAPETAAKRCLASSSVAPVLSGDEHSLRPGEACFSRRPHHTMGDGGRR